RIRRGARRGGGTRGREWSRPTRVPEFRLAARRSFRSMRPWGRMRRMRSSSLLVTTLALVVSCTGEMRGVPMAINDPLDLIDDVQGPLRLFVLPSEMFSCDAT